MTDPMHPVPAAGIVCFREDDVLLIKRGTPPRLDEWSIPGGKIKWGERAADAALRELREETSVEARLIGLIDVVDGVFTSRRTGDVTRHYLLVDYAAVWVAGEPVAGDDAAHAEFLSPDRLQDIELWDETRRIIDVARSLTRA
ncbi:MAG: NUDIX hydrolase [Pseudomonadota bacterium]